MAITLDDVEDWICIWADYARGGLSTSETTTEGYLRERLDKAHDSLDWPEAIVEMEKAVLSLYLNRHQYRRVFNAYYLTPGEMSIDEVARRYSLSNRYVSDHLEGAKRYIRWVLTTLTH